MKKARSDSKLKVLPEERQEQIIAWAMEPKSETCPGGLEHARQQLVADGIKVSISTLSEFVSWWRLQRRFAAASERARQIEEMLRAQDPSMSPEKVRDMGQKIFTLEAVEAGDAKTFVALEALALDQRSAAFKGKLEAEKLALAREKFEVQTCERFLKWFSDHKARDIAESKLSNAQKIAALRAEYFADVDALEAAGTVVLPERQ